MIGIYKITNKLNNKVYIGQSNNVLRRLSEHKKQRKVDIDSYINVLGVDNFEFEILEECSKEELNEKEQQYIEQYNSMKDGYNIQQGGYNNSSGEGNGRAKLTEDDIIKIRTAYNNHESPKKYYEKNYKDKISLGQFQGI